MSAPRSRRQRVQEWLAGHDFDALLVRSEMNMRYLSGFSGEGMAVVTREACAVSTDSRYAIEVREEARGWEPIQSAEGHLGGAIAFIRDRGVQRLAFEAERTVYSEFEKIKKQLRGLKLKAVTGVIEDLRLIKDRGEIALIREAARVMDSVLTPLLAQPPLGITERELALQLEADMRRAGADAPAFPTIAAAGPSAAKPHATPGDRILEEGMMLKIDCGARVNGYCSDITRTVFLGTPTEQYREIYAAVYDAQQAAREAVRPGVRTAELDHIARGIIRERGYGDKFGHGLGHGVGLEVHERPGVSERSDVALEKGMVITVEPGIYIEGWGGVRVEDLVAVTGRGHEVLTLTPKAEPER